MHAKGSGAFGTLRVTHDELLLGADADPLAGSPSALETARFFKKGATHLAAAATHPVAAPDV